MREFLKNSFPYYKKYLPVHIFATVCGLFHVVILLVTPQIVSLLVDRVIVPLLGGEAGETASVFSFLIEGIPRDDYVRMFFTLALVLIGFAAAFFVCYFLKWYLSYAFALKSERKLRADALKKIGNASSPFLAKYTAGDLILITTSDPSRISDLYIYVGQWLLEGLLYTVAASVLLANIHYALLFLPLLGSIGCAAIVAHYQKPVRKFFDDVRSSSAELSTSVQESVYGIRTVASFAKEEYRRSLFGKRNKDLLDVNVRGVKIFAKRNFLTECVRVVIFIGEAALALWLAFEGKITAGECTALMGYLSMLVWQISDLLWTVNATQRYLVGGRRYFGFLNDRDEIAEKYGSEVPSQTPSLSLRGVSVKNGENYVLDHIDLDIPYGKKVGIMGRTGSGKTLLVKLMQGLAECDEGEITVDGRPIHDYSRNELLRAFSYAMQNVFLFSNTIAANIALYDPYASEEDIERAGALAEVSEFANRFPSGYMTTIGEKGFGLSGGQKQRISIARALFKNAGVLIFDDVTSALDLETERTVFSNLKANCMEKSLIIVTHRAPALKECDEILFLEEGKIVERGTFRELMETNGNFAEIYRRQIDEIATV